MNVLLNIVSAIFGLNKPKSNEQTFRYKYLRHPCDNEWQYFTITAPDQASADASAVEEFTKVFERKGTVMTYFFSA
jgi:hypothetical protein